MTLNRRRSRLQKFADDHPILLGFLLLTLFSVFVASINLAISSPAPVHIYQSWATKEVRKVVDVKTGKVIPYDPKKHEVPEEHFWVR